MKDLMGNDNGELSFTWINYNVCQYCQNIIIGVHRDGSNNGCKLIKNREGKYARITLGNRKKELDEHNIDSVNGLKGCESFESSGLPAHPKVLESLTEANPLCSTIHSDENARETSWDFAEKRDRSLPCENITSYEEVQ